MKLVANDIIVEALPQTREQQLIRWLWAGASLIGLALMRVAQVGVLGWIILSAVISAFLRGCKRLGGWSLAVIRFGRDAGAYWAGNKR